MNNITDSTTNRTTNNTTGNPNPYESPEHAEDINRSEPYQPRIFSTQGRIGRVRYFVYSIVYNVISMFLVGILAAVLIPSLSEGAPGEPSGAMIAVMGLLYLPIFLCFFVVARRRLHDLNITGWLALVVFVPIVNFFFALYLLLWPGTPDTNNYGPRPTPNSIPLILCGLVAPITIIVILAAVAIPAYQDFSLRSQQVPIQSP